MTAGNKAGQRGQSGLPFAADRGRDAEPAFRFPLGLKIGFWFCIAIAGAIVVRRIIALSTPPSQNAPPQLAALDAYFAAHATLTYVHILFGLVFVALLPLLFWSRTRSSITLQRAVFLIGAVVGITAYAMSRHAIGGWLERAAVLFFNTLFLFALFRAWSSARGRNHLRAQGWMLRATAILLGIATTRPIMGIFFATVRLTHLTPHQFFGVAFWLGFSINTVTIELWLRNHRPVARAAPIIPYA